jgi:sarcosine oxidase subunit gamma
MLVSNSDVSVIPVELRIVDLSEWPRSGLKGAAASAWLEARGGTLPAVHRAIVAADGNLLARLGPHEYLSLARTPNAVQPAGLPDFAFGGDNEPGLCPVPRFAANAWFAVVGPCAAEMLAKVCGLDLRAKNFPDATVAQTIVARISAIVIRDDIDRDARYHLLVERTMAAYLWDVLRDARTEFARGAA